MGITEHVREYEQRYAYSYPRSGHLFDAFNTGVGEGVVIQNNSRIVVENFFACRLNVEQRFMTAVLTAQRPRRPTLQHNS